MARFEGPRPDPRRDVDEEIRFHLEMRARELVERGMPPEEARRAAADSFGDVRAIAAECAGLRVRRERGRARRGFLRGLGMDAAFALRTLQKSPGYAAASLLTLALGIGSTIAVFTVVDGVLLRPLPYPGHDRLAMVWMEGEDVRGEDRELPLSAPNFLDVAAQSRSFDALAAFRASAYSLGEAPGPEPPEPVAGARATAELFATLGVQPLLGRTFTAREAVPGGPAVAVLGYDLWRRRFGGDPAVVGRTISLSGRRTTVLGVMPPGFAFPRGGELPRGLELPARTDLWTPLVFRDDDLRARGTLNLSVVARLRPGATLAAAEADLGAIAARLARAYPRTNGRLGLHAVGLAEQAARPVRRGLLVLLGAVGFVLLIACANVANLLLARTAARRRELAVRAALGAGWGRLARQLVTENVLLALLGGALGLALAAAGTRLMLSLVPGNLPRADDVAVDGSVLLAAGAVAVLAGVAFGLAAAAHVRVSAAAETLAAGGARATGGTRRTAGRRLLAAVEIALSLVLLVGAGLLALSFLRLQGLDPGFRPDHAVTAQVILPTGDRFDPRRDGPRWARSFAQLAENLGSSPGGLAAGAVSELPLSGGFESAGFRIEGEPAPAPEANQTAEFSVVAGDYFRAMGIPLVAGRAFDRRDRAGAPPVVVVSQELARRFFPGRSALGRRLRGGWDFGPGAPPAREIVGVVGDVRQRTLGEEIAPAVYLPEAQSPYPSLTLVVRTAGASDAAAVPAMRAALRRLDPALALDRVRTLADVASGSLARQRFSLAVLASFAAAALVLAMLGLYGVIALSVGERRKEIGVRVALGAEARSILALILGEGAAVAGAGLAAGLGLALAVTRVLRSMLYEVSPTDGLVLAGSAAAVLAVTLLATWLPARRASRVDPATALRAE